MSILTMCGVIKVRFSTEKKRSLVKELRRIYDSKDFALGVLCDLDSDNDIDTLLEYIHTKGNPTSEEVILASMQLAEIKDNKGDR